MFLHVFYLGKIWYLVGDNVKDLFQNIYMKIWEWLVPWMLTRFPRCAALDMFILCIILQFFLQVLEYCKIEWGSTQTTDIISKTEPRNTTKPDASPVKVTLYYESLCPDCKQFIQYQWYPAYQKLQSSGILDVELVPYGNARV